MAHRLTGFTPYQIAREAGLPLSLAQRVCLKASGGDPLVDKIEIAMYGQLAGLDKGVAKLKGLLSAPPMPQKGGYKDVILNLGRQSGKSNILLSSEAVSAAMNPIQDQLSPGQSAFVLIIAPKLELARSAYKAICGLLDRLNVTYIKREALLEAELVDQRIIIEAIVADTDSGRSRTCTAILIDEAAKLPSDPNGAIVDTEIISALRPSLVVLNGKLIRASTPWLPEGSYYSDFMRAYGKSTSTLALSCSTFLANPSVDEAEARSREHDDRRFSREYLALFTASEGLYLRASDIRKCTDKDVYERPYISGQMYGAVLDFASAAGGDENVLGIYHRELKSRGPSLPALDLIVVDKLQGWRGGKEALDLDEVIRSQAAILRSYKVDTLYIDIASRDLLTSVFSQYGIKCVPLSVGVQQQAARFASLLTRIESGGIRLLDDPISFKQLASLSQTMRSSGRYTYQVPSRKIGDDRVDVIAGMLDEGLLATLTPGGDLYNKVDLSWHVGSGVAVDSTWWIRHVSPTGDIQLIPHQPPAGTLESVEAAVARHFRGETCIGDSDILAGIDVHDERWHHPMDMVPIIYGPTKPSYIVGRSNQASSDELEAMRGQEEAHPSYVRGKAGAVGSDTRRTTGWSNEMAVPAPAAPIPGQPSATTSRLVSPAPVTAQQRIDHVHDNWVRFSKRQCFGPR